jgi:hypothetical protein
MFKRIFIGTMVTVLVLAAGASLYNIILAPAMSAQAANQDGITNSYAQGNGYGQGSAVQAQNDAPVADTAPADPQTDTTAPAAEPLILPAPGQGNAANGGYGNGTASTAGNNGNGNGNRWGGQNSSETGSGVPAPQNGFTELITFNGVVQNFAAPYLTLAAADGQLIAAQLGSQNFLTQIGLALANGDAVSVNGFWETSESFAVSQLTLTSSGQVYTFRDELGCPVWRGGPNH